MLRRVRSLVREHRSTAEFHTSEQNPNYIKLMMMEQALASRISEQVPGTTGAAGEINPAVKAAMMKDPKLQNTIKKASAGSSLTRDEQQKLAGVALMTKEAKKDKKHRVMESELQQAQVMMAAQDMVDRLQKMMEEISEMQFKDLPALTDSVKNDIGTEQATQFQTQATAALSNLLTSVQQGKAELESAQGAITGAAPTSIPGLDGEEVPPMGDTGEVDGDADADLDIDADLEIDDKDPKALGRERR